MPKYITLDDLIKAVEKSRNHFSSNSLDINTFTFVLRALKSKEPKERWKPERSKWYWCVDAGGDVQ